MRNFLVCVTTLCVVGCSGEGAGDVTDAGADHAVDVGHEDVEVSVPDPPQALAPCEATSCRRTSLGGPPCLVATHADAFDDTFGIHAYTSMVWDGAETHIRVSTFDDTWEPVIVLARVNDEVLYDGDTGAVRPPFHVRANSGADLVVTTTQATGIIGYVTSVASLASNFEVDVPAGASYELTIESDCGERERCVVNGRDTGDPECGWLHYVGRRVVTRLDGPPDQQLLAAAAASWWSLKQGLMSLDNPIARSECDGTELGPLETCDGATWHVGLAGVDALGHDGIDVEELATRLYDGAMASGILRTTANEAALNREDAATVMASEGTLRTSWLLRNSTIGFAAHAPWVIAACLDGAEAECYGAGSEASRHYAADRDAALQSVNDLQTLLGTIAQ